MKTSTIVVLLLSFNFLFAQTIPSARINNWAHSGYEGTIPSPPITIDLSTIGAIGDGATDNYTIVQNAINAATGRTVLYFPPGNYLLSSTLNLSDSIILRGYSADSTHLLFNFNGAVANGINISGSTPGSFVSVTSGADRGSNFIVVSDASSFTNGDYAELQETNGTWDTQPVSWADNSVGQILHLTSVNGDTLFCDEALRINYLTALNPQVRKIVPRHEVGIECLRMTRVDSVHVGVCLNIYLNYAANCWIKGVESSKSIGSHIEADACTNISISGCYVHENFEYDGTSTHGYGITLFKHTGQCRVENNIMRHLRHSFSLQCGSNGNVIAYNYSIDPNRSEFPANYGADISMHGHYTFSNLFEGNIVQNIQIDQTWGPTGPFNTFFRNRAELYGVLMTSGTVESDSLNFVGNEIPNTGLFMGNYTITGAGHFEYGNNVRGTITPGGTSTLTDQSYYLDSIPVFWTSSIFPTLGTPNYNTGSIPARDRYLAGVNFTVCADEINTGVSAVGNENSIQIYPNPAGKIFTISYNSAYATNTQIKITDVTGKIVLIKNEKIAIGENSISIQSENLPNGIYFMELKNRFTTQTSRLIITGN